MVEYYEKVARIGPISNVLGLREHEMRSNPWYDVLSRVHDSWKEGTTRMEAYRSFALVYDMFMDNIDYVAWSGYVKDLLVEHGVGEGLVLELGCGTGSLTQLLAQAGYEMIGIDCSAEMLGVAMEKKEQAGLDILYLQQDMREFELYGTVAAVVSVCDSMNYILEKEELLEVFRLVNNYLDPGGVFIFDLNTVYKYEQMGEETIAENREDGSFIWDNYYNPQDGINEYDLTIFIPEGSEGMYRKYEETHFQRAYELDTIKKLLIQSGMEYVTAYDAFTREPPKVDSERIYVVARECMKSSIYT
jgi:SAM-dependent methyltransferase